MDIEDSDLMSHFEVNTLGSLRLFRATASLLLLSRQPKFVYISSELASIAGIEHSSSLTVTYGVSKAAGNYLVKKIDAELPDLVAFSINPGYVFLSIEDVQVLTWRMCRFVQTDMGNRDAQFNGPERAPMTIAESVQGIINQVCSSTWV